jgi:hypothetical protein
MKYSSMYAYTNRKKTNENTFFLYRMSFHKIEKEKSVQMRR